MLLHVRRDWLLSLPSDDGRWGVVGYVVTIMHNPQSPSLPYPTPNTCLGGTYVR